VIHLDELLNKFIGLLDQVSELYKALLGVLESEKKAVVDVNLKKINEAVKIKDNLLLKLRILEEQRNHLLGQLAARLACSPHDLTLRKLSHLIPDPHASRLKDCRTDLLALLTEVHRVNENNGTLFAHSLDLVRGSVNLLNNLMAASPVYYRNGNIENRDHSGKLLRSEI
jgi:hypothetical protein